MTTRQAVEGLLVQGVDERIPYQLTTTPWGSDPTDVAVAVYDWGASGKPLVTTTVMPAGSASVAGDVITLPLLRDLTAGHLYRIEVAFTAGGTRWEAYVYVEAEA